MEMHLQVGLCVSPQQETFGLRIVHQKLKQERAPWGGGLKDGGWSRKVVPCAHGGGELRGPEQALKGG